MKYFLSLLCLLAVINHLTAAAQKAAKCNKEKCQPPNCHCSGRDIPGGLSPEETPQFVLLSFDDAVNSRNIEYYKKATLNFERGNPDGCPAAMTFFITHEYTDYSLVNQLYSNGHEIALHSITHSDHDIFKSEKVFEREFSDQRDMISKFANIDKKEIQGLRIPFLQYAGDVEYSFMEKENFTYDSSWPTSTQVSPGLWPYTLDYASLQECPEEEKCPKASHPGKWVLPILSWKDTENRPCPIVDSCINLPKDKTPLVELMKQNFNRQYLTNKAPAGVYTHASWFAQSETNFEAYMEFLDYLTSLDDVFMVTAQDLIKWMRNPVPLSQMTSDAWSKCRLPVEPQCDKKTCELMNYSGEEIWFTGCMDECPAKYPWTNNKYGESKTKSKGK